MSRAPDDSPVELYARMPTLGEPELIHAVVPPGSEILELGCGAGRMTHALLARGHPVVAVDQSPEMLARVRGAPTVLADIERLDLGRTFPAVVLASHLVNRPGDQRRAAFLATCRRHVNADGTVLIERLNPEWASTVTPGGVDVKGMKVAIDGIARDAGHVSAVLTYRFGRRSYAHPFTARILTDADFVYALAGAGLVLRRWLDGWRTWADCGAMT